MRDLIYRLKSLFKMARLVSSDDGPALRKGGLLFQGKTIPGTLFTPYGLMHNPPQNSIVMVWSQNAQDSNPIGIADDPRNRILKNLTQGEVALGNYKTGSYIYLKENNNIEIKVGATTYTFTDGALIVTNGDVIADGISLKHHVHDNVQSGNDITGEPVP